MRDIKPFARRLSGGRMPMKNARFAPWKERQIAIMVQIYLKYLLAIETKIS
jgi:hypothetical protein